MLRQNWGLTPACQSLPQQSLCREALLFGLLVQLSAVHPLPLTKGVQGRVALRLQLHEVEYNKTGKKRLHFTLQDKRSFQLVTVEPYYQVIYLRNNFLAQTPHTLELRRVTDAPRSIKSWATLKWPQESASWRGVTPSHKGPPASLMLEPWSSSTATTSGGWSDKSKMWGFLCFSHNF